ncbi:hypothetical protein FO519_002884 [Halicephalobus sp. NKZ332]|nr:hypothetical protein FO519_002884 [Halicephalobus sp. NKZ332]
MGFELRRAAASRGKKASPPFPSHEFIIQNHGDIVSCILMVVALGFFFQFSTPLATLFVMPQYNETIALPKDGFPQTYYRAGVWDWPSIIFYTIVWITIHCVIQEYALDKAQRKLHMSKARMSKFNESGQLAVFAVYSIIHAGSLLHELGVHKDLTVLWLGYPDTHIYMDISTKFYFILHIAYWIHQYPEFYFSKVRKEDIPQRTFYSTAFLLVNVAAYFTGFVRIALLLLFLESVLLAVFHTTRALYFYGKISNSSSAFRLWNLTFILVRFGSIILSVLTFWYGFRNSEVPSVDPVKNNYNTSFIRFVTLLVIFGLEFYTLWTFFVFHFARFRERSKALSCPLETSKIC